MKKVSFRVRNFDKEQFLTYNIDNEADLDDEVLDFLEEEEPDGIVPIIFDDQEEECDTFSYDITDKIHLTELSNQEINAELVLMVMRGIVISLTNMAEYRIPLSYLVLHRNYVYIDSDYKVEFICVPVLGMDEEVDINGFLRGILASIRYDTSENGDYVAKLLSYINNGAIFNLHNLLTLIEDLMDDYGIEIPEDDENGIYVDYQEVDDSEEDFGETTLLREESATIEDAVDGEEDLETVMEESQPEEAGVLEAEASESVTEEVAEESEELEADESDLQPEEENLEELDSDESDLRPEEELDIEESDIVQEEVLEEPDVQSDESDIQSDESDIRSDESGDGKNTEEVFDDAQELINKIKQQVMEEKKKPVFKTKDTPVTGVVIHDELDDFLAEKEEEDRKANKDGNSIKIKKNIKISRASIVNNSLEEQRELEEDAVPEDEGEEVSGSILSQTIGTTGILKGTGAMPKVNPYLVRVNTDERIMITKQIFKIGKASMGVDYSVRGNGAVSRIHAILSNRDNVYYIKDNKSTNHTYVNGKILDEGQEELLTHDSKIMLGDEEFVFKLR